MDCGTPAFPVLHYLPDFAQTYITESVIHPIILSSVIPFSSCLQSFPAAGSFPVSWLFASDGQSTGASASASVLPMNIQDAPIKKKRNSKILTPTTTWMSFKNIILNNNNKNRYRIMSPGNILYASLYMKCSNGQSSSMMMEIRKQLPLWAGRQRSTGKGYAGTFRGDWKCFTSRPWLRW